MAAAADSSLNKLVHGRFSLRWSRWIWLKWKFQICLRCTKINNMLAIIRAWKGCRAASKRKVAKHNKTLGKTENLVDRTMSGAG